MIRAFARTRALKGPGRADVDLAMTKWWGKKRPAEGQVSELSAVVLLCCAVLCHVILSRKQSIRTNKAFSKRHPKHYLIMVFLFILFMLPMHETRHYTSLIFFRSVYSICIPLSLIHSLPDHENDLCP